MNNSTKTWPQDNQINRILLTKKWMLRVNNTLGNFIFNVLVGGQALQSIPILEMRNYGLVRCISSVGHWEPNRQDKSSHWSNHPFICWYWFRSIVYRIQLVPYFGSATKRAKLLRASNCAVWRSFDLSRRYFLNLIHHGDEPAFKQRWRADRPMSVTGSEASWFLA